jgi:hypothetical protein
MRRTWASSHIRMQWRDWWNFDWYFAFCANLIDALFCFSSCKFSTFWAIVSSHSISPNSSSSGDRLAMRSATIWQWLDGRYLQLAPMAFLSFNVTASNSNSFFVSVWISTAYALITCLTCPDWKLIFAFRITFVCGPVMGISVLPNFLETICRKKKLFTKLLKSLKSTAYTAQLSENTMIIHPGADILR